MDLCGPPARERSRIAPLPTVDGKMSSLGHPAVKPVT